MKKRDAINLLWWLPSLIAAAVAGIMPDTFLDSPYTTIPHEAAFLIRGWIIFGAFGYIALVIAIRALTYLGRRIIAVERRGFPVVVNAPGQSAR